MSAIRTALRLIATAGGALAIAAPAHAALPLGEQVDRGTGPAGPSALNAAIPTARAISDDGRTAIFDYDVRSPAGASQDATGRALSGVYLRDTVADTTRQIVVGTATTTGITDDATKLSVLTREALTSADTNGTVDLYLVDIATGKATLVPTGGGDGLVGAVTRDGSAVVWGGTGGTWRQPLPSGTAVNLSSHILAEHALTLYDPFASRPTIEPFLVNHAFISRDGRAAVVVDVQTKPAGGFITRYLVGRPGAAEQLIGDDAHIQRPWISADATTVVGPATNSIYVANLATSAVTQLAVGLSPQLQDVSANGQRVVLAINTGVARIVDVPTRAVTDLTLTGSSGASLLTSPSMTFGLIGTKDLYAIPLGSTPLPEAPDAPSAFAYLGFAAGCTVPSSSLIGPTRPSIGFGGTTGLMPAAAAASLLIHAANGAVVGGQAYAVKPGQWLSLPLGWVGGWTLDATVKLADGRTLTGHWVQSRYTDTPPCPTVGYL